MASFLEEAIDEKLEEKYKSISKKTNSYMRFKSNFSGKVLSFEWLDKVEYACPYIDTLIRVPKVALVREEEVIEVERAKKVNVDSVKHLVKHTNLINNVTKENEVEPLKILDIRNEETFNIYENRFLYTLLDSLTKFIIEQEELLDELELKNSKVLEYLADSKYETERIHIELRITSNDLSYEGQLSDKNFQKKIKDIRTRIKRVKEYLSSWERSQMVKELDKLRVPFVKMPLKKTNLILKNPNFQESVKLFEYIYNYYSNNDNVRKNNIETDGDELIKKYLDQAFLINYSVMDSMSRKKRDQKDKINKYAVSILKHQIEATLELINKSGNEISEEELLGIIASELKSDKENRLVGADDVKKKFKNAMDEYLERMQENL